MRVKNYLSLIKFSHTIFAMPFALIGFFLAVQHMGSLDALFDSPFQYYLAGQTIHGLNPVLKFYLKIFALVIFCMVFARSAAMAFNRYIDRKFDAQNRRTAVREIPSGIITPANALLFVIINSVLFVTTTFFINRLCFFLSPIALLVVLGYSYTKRFTALCHLILGLGLSLAPIGAWLAVTGKFDTLPLIFSFVVISWVSGFDIIYALQDEEFDRSQNLRSIPAALGKRNALAVSVFLHVLSGSLVLFAGYYAAFGFWYWIGAGIFIGLLVFQHSIVKPDDLGRVNLAFMTTNGMASVIFSVFVLLELLVK